MEKLPVTSYIRLVDIWLIFGQIIPFVEVKFGKIVFRSSFMPYSRLLFLQLLKFSMKTTLSTTTVFPEMSPRLNLLEKQKIKQKRNCGILSSLWVKLFYWKQKYLNIYCLFRNKRSPDFRGSLCFILHFSRKFVLL